jgi:hypothetical protein
LKMPKFSPNKGAPNKDDSLEDFLKPSNTDPYQASASGHGFNARFDDDAGTHNYAGHGVDGAGDNEAFLRASDTGPDIDAPHQRLSGLIDNQADLPAGRQLGGGGPVSDNKHGGVRPGRPRYAAKNVGAAGQKNWDSKGGRDCNGGRR